jgi:hypothetical protein
MSASRGLISTAVLFAMASPAAGQATVHSVIPAVNDVRVQRAGATARPERATKGLLLQPGDLLTAGDTSSLLEMRCATQTTTTYRLKAPFRVLVDVPTDTSCHVNLLAGHGDVIAESPTTTTAGGIPLGSTGTQYSVEVSRVGEELVRRLVVFEGAVKLRATGEAVEQGASVKWAGGARTAAAVSPDEIERSAAVYARFDVWAARAASPELDTAAAYRQMKQLQYDVLANPTDTAKRVDLAKRQILLKVNDQAAYNLKRANVTSDSALIRYQINPEMIKADPVMRDRIYRKPAAETIRPDTRSAAVNPAATTRETVVPRDRTVTPGAASRTGAAVTTGGDISRGAVVATRMTTSTDSDLRLIATGYVDDAIRNLEARVAANSATSRDHYALAKAYASRNAAKLREHAGRALVLHASDSKLTAAELRELGELVARVP